MVAFTDVLTASVSNAPAIAPLRASEEPKVSNLSSIVVPMSSPTSAIMAFVTAVLKPVEDTMVSMLMPSEKSTTWTAELGLEMS